MKKIKWIVLPYIVMGICIAIGLVIGMAPELLGDVIPRHDVIGRMLTAANHRKIQDSQPERWTWLVLLVSLMLWPPMGLLMSLVQR